MRTNVLGIFGLALAAQIGCTTQAPRVLPSIEAFTQEESFQDFAAKSALWQEQRHRKRPHKSALEEITVTAHKRESTIRDVPQSITNNQEVGVDEGDIVKRVGDYIVVLRRGRLFSYALGKGTGPIKAVSFLDIGGQNEDIDAWYDEMLVYQNSLILIGFSYDIEATLIRKYAISGAGELKHVDSFFFASGDYFDSDNYATRLIGNQLVFYMPRELDTDAQGAAGRIVDGEPRDVGPALEGETIYKPVQHSDYPIVHTIARCRVDAPEFRCNGTGIVGPPAQLLYISNDAVYLWLNSSGWAFDYFVMNDRWLRRAARRYWDAPEKEENRAVAYRIPIDGAMPSMVGVWGRPMDQFSFTETETALRVIVRLEDLDEEAVLPGLLDVPLSQFGTTLAQVPQDQIVSLPPLKGDMTANRFVGSKLLYNDTSYYYHDDFHSTLLIKDIDDLGPPIAFDLEHYVERIEPVGDQVLAIGSDNDTGLKISAFGMQEGEPIRGQTLNLRGTVQADGRSHSFNYQFRPEGSSVLGLPVIKVPTDIEYEDFWVDREHDVEMRFFSLDASLGLSELGILASATPAEDFCLVSCTDWYGDARPFFIEDRVFALIGYELIEGYVSGEQVYESSRTNGLELLTESYLRDLSRMGNIEH